MPAAVSGKVPLNCSLIIFLGFFKVLFIYFLTEGKGGRKGEKHQCVVASHVPPSGDLTHNPGTCPDWESNQRPFGSQAGTQSTEPHQPGLLPDNIKGDAKGKGCGA